MYDQIFYEKYIIHANKIDDIQHFTKRKRFTTKAYPLQRPMPAGHQTVWSVGFPLHQTQAELR